MARRAVLVLAVVMVTTLLTSAVSAQGARKPARIAVVCGSQCTGGGYDAFYRGLRELGYVEGQNLALDVRGAGGQADRLPGLVAELIAAKPDLIVAVAPQPTKAAKEATSTIPILMLAVADPVALGVVQSLARPAGNLTGFTTLDPDAFVAKSLQLVKELVPGASRLAALFNPTNSVARALMAKQVPAAAETLGVRVQIIEASDPAHLSGAVELAVRERADAVLVVGDPLFHRPTNRLPDLMLRAKLPALYIDRDVVALGGGLISYGPDFIHMFRRGADVADRILKGAKPADIPVEQPTKYTLAINQRTAKALGLTVPPGLLLRADEIIE